MRPSKADPSKGKDVMTPLVWMVGVCVGSWLVLAMVGGSRVNPEGLLGMIGPLVSACGTWVLVARTHAAAPGRVMNVMVAAFAVKLVFFGAYVALMVRILSVRPVPFVASFMSFFVGLYVMEALFLRRLFRDGSRAS
jgi:hypothetical protein